jgi:hypothetical protein
MGDYEINVCIITKDRRRPRYYTCRRALDKGHSEPCNYLLPVSFADLEGKSFLTFSCASVDSVCFVGKHLYLVDDEQNHKALTMASDLYIH